jgi:hypothetical protein
MASKSRDELIRMIKNTSNDDFKDVKAAFKQYYPWSHRLTTIASVLRLARNKPPSLQSKAWLKIYDAFRSYGNKGKRAAKRKAKKKPARKKAARKQTSGNNDRDDEKQGVVADTAYTKPAKKKAAKKKVGKNTLRAKRIKLSAKKKASVTQARVAFGRIPIWKLRKVPLLKLYGTHFPNG